LPAVAKTLGASVEKEWLGVVAMRRVSNSQCFESVIGDYFNRQEFLWRIRFVIVIDVLLAKLQAMREQRAAVTC
jgi:hypothetical protein